MQNFQDTFEPRKRSFISAFSICMTVPLKGNSNNKGKKIRLKRFQWLRFPKTVKRSFLIVIISRTQ